MAYQPPRGWLEVRSELERTNVFHEQRDCPSAAPGNPVLAVDRPGRATQCPRCVKHTAAAILAS